MPVYSPFLWLQSGKEGKKNTSCSVPIDLGQGDLTKRLQQVRNMVGVSDQMYHMWKLHTMTDTSLRLRFLVCRQVELAISGLFPRAQVLPFGSAVNCSCCWTSTRTGRRRWPAGWCSKPRGQCMEGRGPRYRGIVRRLLSSFNHSCLAARMSRKFSMPGFLSLSTYLGWLGLSVISPCL